MKLYELIFYINNIKIIDQKEYLLIILKIINLDIDSIVNEFSSYKFTSLLNLSYIVDNINNIKNLITQKNFLIAKIFLLKKHINTNNEQKIIKKISNILSKDFFNYYNSSEILDLLCNSLTNFKDVCFFLLKFKNYFKEIYDKACNKYIYLYSENSFISLNYEIKNNKFKELIYDLYSVNKIFT
jgi:hypothetical protein